MSTIAAGLLLMATTTASAAPILELDSQDAAGGLALQAGPTIDDDLKGSLFVKLGLLLAQLALLKGEPIPQGGDIDQPIGDSSGGLTMIGSGLCTEPPGNNPVSAIPEPGTFLMLGLGLIGLVAFDRRIGKNR